MILSTGRDNMSRHVWTVDCWMLRGSRHLHNIRAASFSPFAGWWERADVQHQQVRVPAQPRRPWWGGCSLYPTAPHLPAVPLSPGCAWGCLWGLASHTSSGWVPLCKHIPAVATLTFFAPPGCLLQLALLEHSAGAHPVCFSLCHLPRGKAVN